jgi:hypothetical protein
MKLKLRPSIVAAVALASCTSIDRQTTAPEARYSAYDKQCGFRPSDYTDRPLYVTNCRLSMMRIEGCYKDKILEDCIEGNVPPSHWPRDAH